MWENVYMHKCAGERGLLEIRNTFVKGIPEQGLEEYKVLAHE